MELLEHENEREHIIKIFDKMNEFLLLRCDEITDDIAKSCTDLLLLLQNTEEPDMLFCKEVITYLFLIENIFGSNPDILQLINAYKSNILENVVEEKTKDAEKEPEQIRSGDGVVFELPEPGTYGTLTTRTLYKNGFLVRNLVIDSEGHVVKELSRKIEDMYTHESEEIYTRLYLDCMKKNNS